MLAVSGAPPPGAIRVPFAFLSGGPGMGGEYMGGARARAYRLAFWKKNKKNKKKLKNLLTIHDVV